MTSRARPPRPDFPEGWFHLANSRELPVGGVLARRMSGRELVVFRGEDGRVGALDAHCPHMGAHLGHGGRVCGNAIRCPFHHIRWNADGSPAGTAYAGDPRVPYAAIAYPVHELHGAIMAFYSADRRAPEWRLPELARAGWTAPISRTLELDGHVFDINDNGLDYGHFAAVHGYAIVGEPEARVDGPVLYSKFTFERAHPLGRRLGVVRSVFDTAVHGLGFTVSDVRTPDLGLHLRVILLSRQIEARRVSFTVQLSARTAAVGDGRLARALSVPVVKRLALPWMLRVIVHDVRQDLDIWKHMRPVDPPRLVRGDGPIGLARRWGRQFYPRAAPAG